MSDERFDDTRDLIARLIRERDEFAAAVAQIVTLFSEVSLKGHKAGYDWNGDPENLTLIGSRIFEARYEPEKVLRAHDMKIIEPLLNTLEMLRPHVRDMYIHVPGGGTDTAGHIIDMAIVTAVSEGE
jgi:hypothetical protein